MKPPITESWGKLKREADGTVLEWHPLRHHCCDVAACFQSIIKQKAIRSRLACLADIDEIDDKMIECLLVFAFLHDFGKCNRCFQERQNSSRKNAVFSGHVREGLSIFRTRGAIEGRVSKIFKPLLSLGLDQSLVNIFCSSVCHHGKPFKLDNIDPLLSHCWNSDEMIDPINSLSNLIDYCKSLFPMTFQRNGLLLPKTQEFYHAFNGILTLSDWLGSNSNVFPYSESTEEDRWEFACSRAEFIVKATGISADVGRRFLAGKTVSFNLVSTFEPRPMQRLIETIDISRSGSIVILEAETGSGKTEAALLYFFRLFTAGAVDGIYFALPTRTSAVQIWERVKRIIASVFEDSGYPPEVTLAVPGYLDPKDQPGHFHLDELCEDNSYERLRHWASESPKKYLAGVIVIGTIDQILLSGLQIPHTHLRAGTLLRHLLVVDEVHASDAYMNSILLEVVRRQIRSGSHVLLMSATLGIATKQMMVAAGTMGISTPSIEQATNESYPLITVGSKSGIAKYHPPISKSIQVKTIEVSLTKTIADPQKISEIALSAALKGAKVLVIRNTVKDCIKTQRSLETLSKISNSMSCLFCLKGVPAPHHSRFARIDRIHLDKALEQYLGHNSKNSPVIAIATQTVQQSLDIDSDFLITDICPSDVLLQRFGRLHRHDRPSRPSEFEKPQAMVLVPTDRNLHSFINRAGPASGSAKSPHGLGTVYEDLRIIDATWRQLEKNRFLNIPDDCRKLVERSTHPEILAQYSVKNADEWKLHEAFIRGNMITKKGTAIQNCIDWRKAFSDFDFSSDVEVRISSRLGLRDRIVTFKNAIQGPFDYAIESISIPGSLIQNSNGNDEIVEAKQLDSGFTFDYSGHSFTYDRYGLVLNQNQETKELLDYE
ncbi:CRISPR-associated helicase Cas3' [bacterium]|nr:CRISPR-associated helicase Cas3' [candidate division CSSED10-310 bacterium]